MRKPLVQMIEAMEEIPFDLSASRNDFRNGAAAGDLAP